MPLRRRQSQPAHGFDGAAGVAVAGASGGPNFLGDTGIIAMLTVTGDYVCRATNVGYRLDTEAARSFLAPYVALL